MCTQLPLLSVLLKLCGIQFRAPGASSPKFGCSPNHHAPVLIRTECKLACLLAAAAAAKRGEVAPRASTGGHKPWLVAPIQ